MFCDLKREKMQIGDLIEHNSEGLCLIINNPSANDPYHIKVVTINNCEIIDDCRNVEELDDCDCYRLVKRGCDLKLIEV